LFALIPLLFLPLTGCGGGGGTTMTTPTPPPPPSQVIATPGPPNVENVVVDCGANCLTTPAVNTAFVSVKVCMPDGTFATCQTIDHVEVDTGSIGLRIIAAGAPGGLLSLALPAEQGVATLAECLQFADGSSWGTVNVADIKLPVSGETATNVQIEVIGAPAAGSPPAACPGIPENTVTTFGAYGILGVGPFINDCNSLGDCVPRPTPTSAGYFTCPTPTTCTTTTAHLASSNTHPYQVPNPIVLFAKHQDGSVDNNGVIIELPPVSASGAAGPVSGGALVFGIGTQGNNAMTGATKLPADASSGVISAMLNGSTYPNSYLDSGSNANFFSDASLSACMGANSGFYCTGGSPVSESATLQGTNGMMLTADFSVADAGTLFSNVNLVAFSNLGGPNSDGTALDLGLSFFYGRNIFTGLEDPNVTPPYFAY
jgi:hypothetical protein